MEQVHKIVWLMIIINFVTFVSSLYFLTNIFDKSRVTPFRLSVTIFVPIWIAQHGLKKKSLSLSGALVGIIIASLTILCHWAFLFGLLGFYLTGSKVTKYKAEFKQKIEGLSYKEGGQRNWVQVVCNAAVGFQICIFYALNVGLALDIPMDARRFPVSTYLGCAYLSAMACCNGDTWASELGSVLSRSEPILITTFQKVPRGTNGGISTIGTLASCFGGLIVGFCFYVGILLGSPKSAQMESPHQYHVIFIGGMAGILGSIIDSLLGATLQYSGWDEKQNCVVEYPHGPHVKKISGTYILDNHSVNLLSSLFTAAIVPYLTVDYF